MDERKEFEGVGDVFESTETQDKMKLDLNNIEATPSGLETESRFGEAEEIESTPAYEEIPEESFEPVAEPVVEEAPTAPVEKKAKKEKKPKAKKDKEKMHKILRIAIIVIVSIATLWTVMYTVDHVLACQGITPFFSVSETVYEDGSLSYKCLGYKVQFMFDANDNLTQKCVPFWEDGPNDIRFARGELFEAY